MLTASVTSASSIPASRSAICPIRVPFVIRTRFAPLPQPPGNPGSAPWHKGTSGESLREASDDQHARRGARPHVSRSVTGVHVQFRQVDAVAGPVRVPPRVPEPGGLPRDYGRGADRVPPSWRADRVRPAYRADLR